MSRARHLQQLLDELRERERLSKLHNRELLQQFDEAQNTLREVLDHTAVMKMLWREYKNCTGSCPRCHHLLNQKIHTAEENKNPVTHSQGKPETHQDLSNPLELAYSSKSYSLHSSSPNQTKQPSSGEDNSNSGDLDVKPVRLSSDLTGSEASSRVSMQGSTPKRKGNRISTDEDSSTSHKFSPKDVTTESSECDAVEDRPVKDLKTKSGAEDTDSEDCIVSPKIRSSIIHVIPEHVGQTEESQQTSTDEDSKSSSEEEDIEDVLEPREKTEKQREPNTDEKSKGPCETLIKQSVKNGEINHHSDSNESDDFYD
uniref:Uncharacterized protein n=1 Tax=Knipowitschia caucasica TaxID=637954 RepID=A0AAV2MJS6_KNICA